MDAPSCFNVQLVLNKLGSIYLQECYTAVRRNELMCMHLYAKIPTYIAKLEKKKKERDGESYVQGGAIQKKTKTKQTNLPHQKNLHINKIYTCKIRLSMYDIHGILSTK